MKTLILYYSYGGNTKRIAEMIQREIGGDIARMDTVVPYDGDYDEVVNQGQREIAEGYCPELKPLHIGWRDYDTIILGSPVWWYTFAPAMRSFLERADLTGKIVYPFATNGGWLGHALKDFEEACKGAIVKPGLDVQFDESMLRTSEKDIQAWINTICRQSICSFRHPPQNRQGFGMIPKMQTERSDFLSERPSLPSCPFSSPSPGDPGAGAGRRLSALRPQRPGKSRGQPPARLEARVRVRPRPGAAQRLFRRGHASGIGSL